MCHLWSQIMMMSLNGNANNYNLQSGSLSSLCDAPISSIAGWLCARKRKCIFTPFEKIPGDLITVFGNFCEYIIETSHVVGEAWNAYFGWWGRIVPKLLSECQNKLQKVCW